MPAGEAPALPDELLLAHKHSEPTSQTRPAASPSTASRHTEPETCLPPAEATASTLLADIGHARQLVHRLAARPPPSLMSRMPPSSWISSEPAALPAGTTHQRHATAREAQPCRPPASTAPALPAAPYPRESYLISTVQNHSENTHRKNTAVYPIK